MVSRKGSTTSSNDSTLATATDAATQLAISYVQEFSLQVSQYRTHKTEEALVLLHRNASLLSTAIKPQHFNPAQLEMAKFFIDLHTAMDALPLDSDALWVCVAVLQHCSTNLEARCAIVAEYRFVPLLTSILKRTQAQEKQQRLLILLQDLTYGIRISWEEPYIVVLLEQLVQIVYGAEEAGKTLESGEEQSLAQLALSILINLCYKNFVVHFLLLRSVNMSSFSRTIKDYGMLANKMLIILSEDIHAPDEHELHSFMRSTFASVNDCIKRWHVPHLRHIVEFLVDSKTHNGLHCAMLSYPHYCEDIERLLNQLEARTSMDDSDEDSHKQQKICLGMLFQLISYILELGVVPQADGSENVISLDSNVPRIFELLCNWFESEVCGVDAVNLLEALVRLAKKESVAPRIARDPSIVVQLIATTEKQETTAQHTAAILQLLLTLLHQAKTEKLILSKITESYFDKIFAPLLAIKADMSTHTISLAEIEKSIFCLLLLINFAGIAKKAYFEKCCTVLQLQQIQQALARAMISGSEMVCSAVFQISQFEHFPQAQVAKHISKLNVSAAHALIPTAATGRQQCNINAILKSHQTSVSKELEQRLLALIETIANAQRNNQLQNVATSQIIELFNYKIEKFNCAESSMQKRLEDASNEVTNLTQRINLQNAELQKYHTMNFELHINQESLQTRCKDLKQQKDNLKRNTKDLIKTLTDRNECLQISEKRLAVKVSEMIVLQKEYNDQKEHLHAKTEELEKLQVTSKENFTRIDKLKKTITAFEVDIKEKLRTIEEKERELTKTQKLLDEQKEAKKKSDGVIGMLETQLRERSEQLRSCELELSETEEMRKTIMSLMESKKPKRKA